MRKVLAFLLAAAMVLSLAACGAEAQPGTTADTTDDTTETTQATEETFAPIYTRPDEDVEDGEFDQEDSDQEDTEDSEDASGSAGGSAGGGSAADDDTGDTFADGSVVSNSRGVAKNLTWANINAFPIKSSAMSVAQMRSLCVDFFRYAKTALWTPDESIRYIKNAKGTADSMTGGTLYGGLPYVGNASGNIYRLIDYLDESTGKVDMSDMLNLTGGQLETTDLRYFGNQCANGVRVGWGRVINSVSKFYTAAITKANGYIPLGDYTYDNQIEAWSTEYGTDECCRENGEQTMYRSYALLQMADGLVYYTTAGHVIMAATAAHVEYAADGSIDPDNSYITIIDQAQKWETHVAADGRDCQIKSSVDAKVTFRKLYESNYLPFTFGEFVGTNGVEATSCTFSHTDSTITKKQLLTGKVTSNYSITDAYAIVTDSAGNQVYKHAVRNSSSFGYTLTMKETGSNVDSWGTLASGTYTVRVEVQLATGERPTVYTGTLTV